MEDTQTPPSTIDLLAVLRDRREARARNAAADPAAERSSPHLLAAAVLHVFDPATLRPIDGGDARGAFEALFDASAPAIGWPGLRTLRLDMRRRAIRQLGGPAAVRMALAANPDRRLTLLQGLFERAVAGEIDLGQMSFAELEELKQLYDWKLEAIVPMPSPSAFRAAHRKRASVARFEHLVDHDFVGRDSDLQVLRDHVGVVSPSVWARVRAFFSAEQRRPLFVSAPGGGGKTALLGRFLLEHIGSPPNGWFPFAYCAFDSETLDVREPFTLLVEIAGQLAAQVEQAAPAARRALLEDAIEEYRRSVTDYRDARAQLASRASPFPTQIGRVSSLGEHEERLLGQFTTLLRHLSREAGEQQRAKSVPVLLVFDTFEEVVYRAREDLIGFWRMLSGLSERHPPLRVVIAGRAGPDLETGKRQGLLEHRLAELKPADAATLLGRLGVRPEARAAAIAGQIGGNPLSLRLAARVAAGEVSGSEGLEGLPNRRFGVLKVSPELIRGQLYRRILDHIHDDEVRALAHPGMVLRRVTSAIVERVLAPLCGIPSNLADARKLFELLREEHALVRLDGDGALRYREEVRRPMLSLMAQDKPETVQAIHEAAVGFYSAHEHSDATERAEEIYHRLMLGQEGWELDDRWLPGVERHLATAIEEIPLPQRLWLAQRMSIELAPEILVMADLASWERLIGPKVLGLIRYADFTSAERMLEERTARTPDSPLHALHARVLMALSRPAEAIQRLEIALGGYPPLGDQARSAELMWLLAQGQFQVGDDTRANETLAALVDVARGLARPLMLVQALTELIARGSASAAGCNLLREELAVALSALTPREIDDERSLIRLALIRLGSGYPVIAGRLLPQVYPEWADRAKAGMVDVEPVLSAAMESLAASAVPQFAELGGFVLASAWAGRLPRLLDGVAALLSLTFQESLFLDTSALDGILRLLNAEGTSLSSATLAGLDDVRQGWESDVAPEAFT